MMTDVTPQEPKTSARPPDHAERIVLGCCALAALLCFAPWYTVDMEMPSGFGGHSSAQGFDSWHGVLVFLLSLAAAGAVLAERSPAVGIDRRTARLAAVASCGLAWLIAVIYVASVDDAVWMSMESGKTVWPYLALAATGVATYFAFTRLGALPPPETG